IEAVPSLMRQLVESIRAAKVASDYPSIRMVMTGGDLIPPDLLHDLRQTFPHAAIFPTYGPTESAVMATGYRIPPGQQILRPILGKPLGNRTIHILDTHGQP